MNLVLDGTKVTREEWDNLYSEIHPKLPGTLVPVWNYQHNMCTDCSKPLDFCRNNPYSIFGEIRIQRREALRVLELAAREAQGENVASVLTPEEREARGMEAPSTRRKRGSVLAALPESDWDAFLAEFDAEGQAVALSAKWNVRYTWTKEFLESRNRTLRRGGFVNKSLGTATSVTRKTRTTLTDEEKTDLLARCANGTFKGIVAESKELNVQPPYLSEFVKSHGVVITRGRKKAA